MFFGQLKNEYDIIYNYKAVFPVRSRRKAIFGLFENYMGRSIGKIGVFGDSSCLELRGKDCRVIVDFFLDFLENEYKNLNEHLIEEDY